MFIGCYGLSEILAIGHDLKINSIISTSLEVFELTLYRVRL